MTSFVIGDIHGCADELRYLIDGLPVRPDDEIIFLGDYIDRGPDSCGVVSFLIKLKDQLTENRLVFLKGNHEDMLLSYLEIERPTWQNVFAQRRAMLRSKAMESPPKFRHGSLERCDPARPSGLLPSTGKLLRDRALLLRSRRRQPAQDFAGADRRRVIVDSSSVPVKAPTCFRTRYFSVIRLNTRYSTICRTKSVSIPAWSTAIC